MAKSRSKIQQIGFWDAEVSDPTHDEICLWIHKHAEQLMQRAFPSFYNCAWTESDYDSRARAGDLTHSAAREFMRSTQKPNIRVVARLLEEPLVRRTGYRESIEIIVGYGDVIIQTERPQVIPVFHTSDPNEETTEFNITWTRYRSPSLLAEAKTVLPTIGELMRQLKLYKTAFGPSIAVVCPDASYEDIISDQGFLYLKYERDRT